MKVELLACKGCWRISDQFVYPPICPCGHKISYLVAPILWNIFKWFLSSPKHVIKLFIQDFREKKDESRG